MERFESEIPFGLASNINFDSSASLFPGSPAHQDNPGNSTTIDIAFLRKLSEKFGRGLSQSDVAYHRNQIILNSSSATGAIGGQSSDWISQVEYDKFMNEIWIGIVLTLIVISMVFCICSCFLYHQFRQWKRNFRYSTPQDIDVESEKFNHEDNDSLPSYTIVSGLPSYDDAIDQIQKSSSSSLLIYPSVHKIFKTNDKKEFVTTADNAVASTSTPKEEPAVLPGPIKYDTIILPNKIV